MSIILEKGDLQETSLYFLCLKCGQKWIANSTEYKTISDYPYSIHSMNCECCGAECYGKKCHPALDEYKQRFREG